VLTLLAFAMRTEPHERGPPAVSDDAQVGVDAAGIEVRGGGGLTPDAERAQRQDLLRSCSPFSIRRPACRNSTETSSADKEEMTRQRIRVGCDFTYVAEIGSR
jgi:hypothetical protein